MSWMSDRMQGISVWRRFWPHVATHRWAMLAVSGCALLAACLEVLRPWPLSWIFDGALAPAEPAADRGVTIVVVGVLALIVINLAHAGLEYLATIREAEVGQQVTRSLRHRLFAHLTDLPLSFHARHKSGDLLVRLMGDVPMVRTMLVDSTVALTARCVHLLGMVVVMLLVDPLLTLSALAVIPALLVVVHLLGRRITVAVRKQRTKEGAMADYLHEAMAAVATIQSLGWGQQAVRRFARNNRTSARAGLKATRLAARLSLTVESLLAAVTAGILGLGSWRVLEGQLTPGELLVFLSYVRGMQKPMRSAARHSDKVAKGVACGERLLAVLDADLVVVSAPGAGPAPTAPERLVFDSVVFAYGSGPPVLDGLDATFRRGRLCGLFGRSGAGKSTLASLALRLHDPQRGAVRLDDEDLRAFDLGSLRSRFALCLQETTLFGESVRDNLLLGLPEAGDEQLWEALERVAADAFVAGLPQGLGTLLDAGGGGLSGGQRRRLSLARTLLRRAPLIIVDEPFAGLDRAAVERVRWTLAAEAGRAIVIVICHEPEHLEVLDEVVFLEGGRVVDSGSHAELLARCPTYRAVLGRTPREVAS